MDSLLLLPIVIYPNYTGDTIIYLHTVYNITDHTFINDSLFIPYYRK